MVGKAVSEMLGWPLTLEAVCFHQGSLWVFPLVNLPWQEIQYRRIIEQNSAEYVHIACGCHKTVMVINYLKVAIILSLRSAKFTQAKCGHDEHEGPAIAKLLRAQRSTCNLLQVQVLIDWPPACTCAAALSTCYFHQVQSGND